MARLTFADIVEQGGLIGGNDGVPEWIAIKLKAWLRKHYAAWAWPFLIKQATGVSMPAGSASIGVGAGESSFAPQISRIFSPIYFRADGYSTRGKAPARQFVGGPAEKAIGNIDASTQTGQPMDFVIQDDETAAGLQFKTIYPFPIPDKAYTLAFSYQKLPDDPADTDVPVYPNEMTLIQAAKCAALEYDQSDSPQYQNELNILASMVTADRDAYGGNPSFGDTLQLDDSVFPSDSGTNTSKFWPGG